jgi:hypothetical protein
MRLMDDLVAPKRERRERQLASLQEKYDHVDGDEDLSLLTTDEVTDHLRAAARTEREFRNAGNDEAANVFGAKTLPISMELRARPDYQRALRGMLRDEEPALRYEAAQSLLPDPIAIETLEKLGSA